FAEYAHLANPRGAQVGYSDDGMAFMGATQDPSGFYRFNAVWDQFQNVSIKDLHQHIKEHQLHFIKNLPAIFLSHWKLKALFDSELKWHGHFLTFEAPSENLAEACQKALR